MKNVLTVGVFDLLHWGHFELFRRAKRLAGEGGRLTVAIQNDDVVRLYKPRAKLVYDFATRCKMVADLRSVDEVVPYADVAEVVTRIPFDIFVVGDDQNHDGFLRAIEWCRRNGREVVRLKRTDGISTTLIETLCCK